MNTWHNGSLSGTYTLMVRRFDGLDWVVLFDQRDDLSGLSYDDIDPALHTAANSVTHWSIGFFSRATVSHHAMSTSLISR